MNMAVPEITVRARVARFSISLTVGLVAVGLTAAVAVWGQEYYRLAPADRPFHPDHEVLRPSGQAGLTFGIVAATLFVLNLGYLVRKRFIHLRRLGSLRTWMSFHALTGIVDGGLIFLHAAFTPSSALGMLALVALAITVVSGVIGRYIYAKVPRSLEGRELEFEQVRAQLQAYRRQLEDAGVSAEWLGLPAPPEGYDQPRSVLGRLRAALGGDHRSRRDYRRLRRFILVTPQLRASARRVLPLARAFCRHQHWLTRYQEARNLLASWRFLHRWLAIVMLAVVAFHIGLALHFGDLWIMKGLP